MNKVNTAILLLAYLFASVAAAQTKNVVVVPLGGGLAPADRIIITVGNEPNEGDFQTVQAALASINDAGPSRRYALFLTPGDHGTTGLLQMKEYVDLIGSGREGPFCNLLGTVSSGNSFSNSAVVRAADNMLISNLSILNIGDNPANLYAALEVDGTSPTLRNLRLVGSGGNANYGLLIENNAAPLVEEVSARGNRGRFARGVFITNTGGLELKGLQATASLASSSNRGVLCNNPSDIAGRKNTFQESRIRATGSNAQGIYIEDCDLELLNSSIRSDNEGIRYESEGSEIGDIDVIESTVEAQNILATNAASLAGFAAFRSTFLGNLSGSPGITSCGESDAGQGVELNGFCQEP